MRSHNPGREMPIQRSGNRHRVAAVEQPVQGAEVASCRRHQLGCI